MRDIFILTNTKLSYENCKDIVASRILNADGNEHVISFGEPPKSVYLWFSTDETDERMYNENEAGGFDAELQQLVPMQNPYCVNVEFHRLIDVQKLVSALFECFSELYVIDDDDNVYSGEMFLKLKSI